MCASTLTYAFLSEVFALPFLLGVKVSSRPLVSRMTFSEALSYALRSPASTLVHRPAASSHLTSLVSTKPEYVSLNHSAASTRGSAFSDAAPRQHARAAINRAFILKSALRFLFMAAIIP